MRTRIHRSAVFAAYQTSVMLGIVLLPLAVMLRRTVGIVLPIHRLLEPVRQAYEDASR